MTARCLHTRWVQHSAVFSSYIAFISQHCSAYPVDYRLSALTLLESTQRVQTTDKSDCCTLLNIGERRYPVIRPSAEVSRYLSAKHNRPSGLLCGGSVGRNIHCLSNCVSRLSAAVTFVAGWKLFCSRGVSLGLLSAIEMLCIRLRYINLILTLTLTAY